MKKTLAILLLCICVGMVSGCNKSKENNKERVIECTLSQQLSSYEIKATYKVFAKGDSVNKVDVVETATSENTSILDQLERTLKLQYDNLNQSYGGYTYNVTKTEKQVESKVTIDYNKFNSKKFADDKTNLEQYIKDGRLTVDGVIRAYEANGATCKK